MQVIELNRECSEAKNSRHLLSTVTIAWLLVAAMWNTSDCAAQTSYQKFSDGTLIVSGDSSNTTLKFSKPHGTPLGYLRVRETPSSGSFATIRHFYNVYDVVVNLGDGQNDLLFIYGTEVRGSLSIFGGDDDDEISLLGTDIGEDLYVELGDGENELWCTGLLVAWDAKIVGGRERDRFTTSSSPVTVFGRTEIHLNEGNDFLRLDAFDFHGSTLIDAGPGSDDLISNHTIYNYSQIPQFRGHAEIILGPESDSAPYPDKLTLISCNFQRNLDVRVGRLDAEIEIGEQAFAVAIGDRGSVTVGGEAIFSTHSQANTLFEISNFRTDLYMEIDGGMTDDVRIRNSSFPRDGFRVLLGNGADRFEIESTFFQPSLVRGGYGTDVFTGVAWNPSQLTVVGFEQFNK